jgi:hypothetical protein
LWIFEGKKRAETFKSISEIFHVEFEETNNRSKFLYKKYLISEKNKNK